MMEEGSRLLRLLSNLVRTRSTNVDEVKKSLPKLLSEVASEIRLVESYGISLKFRVVLNAGKSLAHLFV
jgi:hypothetical protein